jgi:hypothetical protein
LLDAILLQRRRAEQVALERVKRLQQRSAQPWIPERV